MVYSFECGPVATNCYVSTHPDTKTAFVIDVPPNSLYRITRAAAQDNCKITDILLTHTHWDHTIDCAELLEQTGATVWVHPNDAYRLIDPNRHTVWPLDIEIQPVTTFKLLEFADLQEIEIVVGDVEAGHVRKLRVLFTPGHTEGGVCYVDETEKCVFVGDTLFRNSVGRTDLPGGDMDALIESVRNEIFSLPKEFTVYPGHGPSTTVHQERQTNMFVGDGVR